MLYAIGGTVVVAAVVVLIVLLQGGGTQIGYEVRTIGGIHAPPFVYVQDAVIEGDAVRIPPTSGNHLVQQSPYGFLGDTLIPEAVVHNMEHGSVVLWYQPDDAALAGQINQFVRAVGGECIVAGTYSDMSYPVVATVWGRVLPLTTFDESQLRAFLSEYRGDAGPEAGVCRQQS